VGKTGLSGEAVDEIFFGNVCSANIGQAPAKQASIGAGIPNTVPCTTVNKVCSSGMKSIMFGAQAIQLGQADIIITGGMESMSNIPYYLPKVRWGLKYGGADLVDGLQKDGLSDAYDHQAMGVSADATAEKYDLSREAQDEFAVNSYQRAEKATTNGKFSEEIIPISIPQRKGDPIIMNEDEEYKKVRFDKIPQLRPAFTKNGTVTAANASTINDGASALILASEVALKKYNLTPIARIVSYADASHDPAWFTTAPTIAAPKAFKRANLNKNDMDLFEVNEAFAAVTMAFNKELDIDPQIVNINGGAVALGHPLGSSGSRITTTLIHALRETNGKYGCATLCNGGGGASALIVERL
jgi:acetyl-CoA C-acetyltransferase